MTPTKEQIERDRATLQDEQSREKLIRWIGSRTRKEILIIIGRKRSIYKYLKQEKQGEGKEITYVEGLDLETEAFLIAAANLRRNAPKDARIIDQIDRERQTRAAARPRPMTIAAKVYEDLEAIMEARKRRATWNEITKTLRQSGKYKGHRITADQIRNAARRLINKKAAEQQNATATEETQGEENNGFFQ